MSIVITRDGDAIEGGPEWGTNRPRPLVDDGSVNSIFVHQVCGGFVDYRRTSSQVATLICRACFLRVTIPLEVRNIGDLRNWSAQNVFMALSPIGSTLGEAIDQCGVSAGERDQ